MAITNITGISNDLINYLDNFSHIAIGDNGTAPSVGNTSLLSEQFRELISETAKDLSAGEYIFTMRLGSVDAVGVTIREVGIFDANTGGNMGIRETVEEYAKTSSDDIWIDVFVEVQTNNN